MDYERDIQPLTDFKRDTSKYIDILEKTGEPMVLTINGKARLVVQDAAAYQQMKTQIARQREYWETVAGIRRGLEDMKAGRGMSVEEGFDMLYKKLGLKQSGKNNAEEV